MQVLQEDSEYPKACLTSTWLHSSKAYYLAYHHVYQMAKEAIKSFPAITSFTMKNTPRAMSRLRAEMAAELLSW